MTYDTIKIHNWQRVAEVDANYDALYMSATQQPTYLLLVDKPNFQTFTVSGWEVTDSALVQVKFYTIL